MVTQLKDYLTQFQGRFIGIMQRQDCNVLLEKLIANPTNDWYFYDTLTTVPQATMSADEFVKSLTLIHGILKTEHQERYCGIVYVDDLESPSFIKIFNPKNLGKSCGSSEYPPIPQWLLSKIKPADVVKKFGSPSEKQGFLNKFF